MDNYIEVYLNGSIFRQRTPHSKIVEFNSKGTKINSYDEIPSGVLNIVRLTESMKENPEYYFDYEKTTDGIKINKIRDKLAITRHLKIPEYIDGLPVVELGEDVMERNLKLRLKQIQLPNTLKRVNSHTFSHCEKLEYINIPDSLTSLAYYCFYGCWSLTNIDLNKVDTLEMGVFADCRKLEEINLENVTDLDQSIFSGCIGLKNVKLADSITELPADMFYNCKSLEKIVIPDSIKAIMQSVFFNCVNLKEIILSKNLELIASNAFQKCISLESFMAPEKLRSIDMLAFHQSGLKELILNDKLDFIAKMAFSECKQLSKIEMSGKTLYKDDAFDFNQKLIIKFRNDTKEVGGYLRV